MSMATIAAVATIGAAGYGVAATASSSRANKKALAGQSKLSKEQFSASNKIAQSQFEQSMALQEEYMAFLMGALEEYGQNAPGIASNTYDKIGSVINNINIPGVSDFMSEAKTLSLDDFNFRDKIQKQNFDFITGGTQPELRDSQNLNASLAALDPSAFEGKMGEVLRSDLYGLKAITVGEPTGTFANLSAQNLRNFSNEGLSNYLAISDFFSREGTVDPISPLQTSFDLQQIKSKEIFDIAGLKIGNEQALGNNLLNIEATRAGMAGNVAQIGMQYGTNAINNLSAGLMGSQNAYSNNLFGVSNAQIANTAATQAGYTQAATQLVSATSGYTANARADKALQQQSDYYKMMLARTSTPTKFS
jgi:hypothetical protein